MPLQRESLAGKESDLHFIADLERTEVLFASWFKLCKNCLVVLKWIMWDSIILTVDRFSPFIAINSTPLWNKNPIKWLKDIDTRIQHKQHLWNYNFYGFRMHFESGIILCIFLWTIILLTVIALLWSRWN